MSELDHSETGEARVSGSRPLVTILLPCRSGIQEATPQLRNLSRQTLRDSLEVFLIVTPGTVSAEDLSEFSELRIRVVDVGAGLGRNACSASALRLAETPYVMPMENHSFLEPTGLEELLEGWSERDAARAPVVRAANPETLRSLAMLLFAYGQAAAPQTDEPVAELPHHNAIYDRTVLESLGDRPEQYLEDEARLHETLTQAGFVLRLVPGVITWHINDSRWKSVFSDPFALALRYGRSRCGGWTWFKRLLYAGGFPLVAAIRLKTLLEKGRRAVDLRGRLTATTPLLALMALMASLGEACAYLGLGPGPESEYWSDFEDHEFHIRGRMVGIDTETVWVRQLLAAIESLP